MAKSDNLRVWDLPTRLFHWALVFCVVAAYVCVKMGGLWMDWHTRFGLATLVLVAFRLLWGIFGPRYARFAQFVKGPRAVVSYLRGGQAAVPGHNPLGACSVVALLLVIGVQATSGLFANDDVMTTGPLAYLSDAWSSRMTWLHNVNEWVILSVVGLHVCAIAWYQLILRKNLVGPMIHGDIPRAQAQSAPAAADTWVVRLGALALLAALCWGAWWLTTLAPAGDYGFM